MTNMREKFIDEAVKLIELKYNHLSDKERNDLMIFKNQKKMSPHSYNRLMELKSKCEVKY